MAGMLGMDVDAVRGVATKLDLQTDVLRQIIATVDQLSGHASAAWHGRDCQDFHGNWHGQHRPALQQVLDALAELAQVLARNVAEQERASGSGAAVTPVMVAGSIQPWWGAAGSTSASFTVGGGGFDARADAEGRLGVGVDATGRADIGPLTLTGDAGARAGLWGDAGGHATGRLDGLRSQFDIGAQAEARTGVQADISGHAQLGVLGVGAMASGFAGARAGAEGHAALSAHGVKVGAGVDAFTGVQATAQTTATLGDEASATAAASVSYGIGFSAHSSYEMTFDKIEADIKLGGALGLGGQVHLDLSVSPKAVLDDLTHLHLSF